MCRRRLWQRSLVGRTHGSAAGAVGTDAADGGSVQCSRCRAVCEVSWWFTHWARAPTHALTTDNRNCSQTAACMHARTVAAHGDGCRVSACMEVVWGTGGGGVTRRTGAPRSTARPGTPRLTARPPPRRPPLPRPDAVIPPSVPAPRTQERAGAAAAGRPACRRTATSGHTRGEGAPAVPVPPPLTSTGKGVHGAGGPQRSPGGSHHGAGSASPSRRECSAGTFPGPAWLARTWASPVQTADGPFALLAEPAGHRGRGCGVGRSNSPPLRHARPRRLAASHPPRLLDSTSQTTSAAKRTSRRRRRRGAGPRVQTEWPEPPRTFPGTSSAQATVPLDTIMLGRAVVHRVEAAVVRPAAARAAMPLPSARLVSTTRAVRGGGHGHGHDAAAHHGDMSAKMAAYQATTARFLGGNVRWRAGPLAVLRRFAHVLAGRGRP